MKKFILGTTTILMSLSISFGVYAGDISSEQVPEVLKIISERNAEFEKFYKPIKELKEFKFQTGDILAISETLADPSTIFFEAATGSRFGHIGVVVVEGEAVSVFEANPPIAQKSSLASFLGRSQIKNKEPQFALLRTADPLTDTEKSKLKATAEKMIMAPTAYNFSMKYEEGTTAETKANCSEFVFKLYQAIGRKNVGKIEKLSDLNVQAFQGFLFQIFQMNGQQLSLDNKVVTPVGIVNSPGLKVLMSTLPTKKVLSDKELFQSWKTLGSITNFAEMMGIDVEQLNQLGEAASETPFKKQH